MLHACITIFNSLFQQIVCSTFLFISKMYVSSLSIQFYLFLIFRFSGRACFIPFVKGNEQGNFKETLKFKSEFTKLKEKINSCLLVLLNQHKVIQELDATWIDSISNLLKIDIDQRCISNYGLLLYLTAKVIPSS